MEQRLFLFFKKFDTKLIFLCYNENMKILVYSDVHGNKYALEKLQKTQDYKNADLRVFCGDGVMMCPYPNECLESIWGSGDVFVLGNHDSYCAYGLPKEWDQFFKADKKDHQSYMRNKTKPEYVEKLKTVPKEYWIEIEGKKFYFTHYAWQTDKLIMLDPDEPDAPTYKTGELFNDIEADYIIFGHNHKPADFFYKGKQFLCVGSLGMKYPANYLIINIASGKVSIRHKKVKYDIERLKQDMIQENYPRAKNYIKWFDEK